MRRDSQRIPTIRKQYVQTIYDGLKTQFDHTLKNQVEDQVDKVQTLKSVYQSSIQAQSSIISFLIQTLKQKKNQNQTTFTQIKQQLCELQKQENQERKSAIINGLNEKMQQTSQIINILNVSLEELKGENQHISNLLTQILTQKQQFQRKYEQILNKFKQNQQLNKKIKSQYRIKFEEDQKKIQKIILQNNAKIAEFEQKVRQKQIKSNKSIILEQEVNIKKQVYQQNSKISQYERKLSELTLIIEKYQVQKKSVQLQNLKIKDSLELSKAENDELKLLKQENQKVIQAMQQQLELLLKFTTCEQKKTQKMKKKLSQRQSITKQQIEKLKQMQVSQQNNFEEPVTMNIKQRDYRRLNRYSDSLSFNSQKDILQKISQKQQEEHYTENSILEMSVHQIVSDMNLTQKTLKQRQRQMQQYEHTESLKQICRIQNIQNQKQNEHSGQIKNPKQQIDNFRSLLLQVRRCESGNIDSIQDEEDQIIDRQIEDIKETIQKRVSQISRGTNSDGSQTQIQHVQQTTEKDRSAVGKMKQQFARLRARQSKRTSSIMNKLDHSRTTATLYQNQLQQQICLLNKKMQTQNLRFQLYINEQNEKIDDLLNKLQDAQEQRVRGMSICQNHQTAIMEKQRTVQMLYTQLEKLRDQNSQFAQICEKSKKDLEIERRKVQNLEDQIRQLDNQRQKLLQEKHRIENEEKYQNQFRKDLQYSLTQKQNQVQQSARKIQTLTHNFEVINKNYLNSKQIVKELESNLLEYQKCIDELESKIAAQNEKDKNYSDQIQRLKKIIAELTQKLNVVQKKVLEKQEQIDRMQYDKKIMEKTNEDLKYMNTILKKDALKVKEIQSIDWQKEYTQNPNLKVSKTLKINNIPCKQELQRNQQRIKNYSFTSGRQFGSMSTAQLKNIPSIRHTITTKQNLISSRVSQKPRQLDLKIDLDFMMKKPSLYIKSQAQQSYLTDRPINQIVKKKYKY